MNHFGLHSIHDHFGPYSSHSHCTSNPPLLAQSRVPNHLTSLHILLPSCVTTHLDPGALGYHHTTRTNIDVHMVEVPASQIPGGIGGPGIAGGELERFGVVLRRCITAKRLCGDVVLRIFSIAQPARQLSNNLSKLLTRLVEMSWHT